MTTAQIEHRRARLLAGRPVARAEPEHSLARRGTAEALGTAILVFIGAGSVPTVLLLEAQTTAAFSGADFAVIAFAFGLSTAAMIYAFARISGCHIDPAITVALAATRRFPWREVPLYVGCQLAGATAGALGIWAMFGGRAKDLGYGFGVVNFDRATTSWGSAFFAEAVGTGILMITVLGVLAARPENPVSGLVVGLVVTAVVLTLGPVTNSAINPARAFGPLLVQTVDGSGVHNWLKLIGAYVPAELIGATLAAFAYDWISRSAPGRRPSAASRPVR